MEIKRRAKKAVHHGRNLKRLREARGIKQDVIAQMVGLTQSSVARIEGKDLIDIETLNKFAQALQVPVEIIQDLEEDPATIVIENNTFENNTFENSNGVVGYNTSVFNPIDKIIELCNEKAVLYERMLELEKEKVIWLEKFLNDKKQ